jgi:chemotaxis protein CheD
MSGKDVGMVPATRGQMLNLLAGQVYFGGQAAQCRTLLGSCVGITLWSPRHRIGGMCHYLLPTRPNGLDGPRDARYGDEAVAMLLEAIQRAGTKPSDYEAHLYGGADTLSAKTGMKFNIGERNIELGWTLIDRHGFDLREVDVGDEVPRNVSLSLVDGRVEMRRGHRSAESETAPKVQRRAA